MEIVKSTFEMFWDCPACDRVGNLGVTHKCCPGCGHPQDATRRYFPSASQRLAVKPPSSGRQVNCTRCAVLNDPSHQHCCACGAPLAGAPQVQLRRSLGEYQGETEADARRDAEARRARERAERIAHHQPAAQRERERQRSAQHQSDRVRDEARAAPMADDFDFAGEDLRSYGIGAGSDLSAQHWLAVAGAFVVAMLVCLVVFWKKDIAVEVQGHTWTRQISIERFNAVHDSDWCTSMPSDAYSVSRHRELHHVDHVPDGQTCRTEPGACSTVDNGNGSGSVRCQPDRRVCETKYRDVPVYENKCSYTVDRWRHVRFATASGSQLEPAPSWPTPKFESCRITHLGCERTGAQTAEYLVHFVSNEDKPRAFECDYPEARWSSFKPDSVWAARVGVLWRRLDCDSVRAPKP
jgi:hypothetical protein